MFYKLTGDLPEAMDKRWQGWKALLWSLIKERSRALLRYSLWDAAIWEKSRLPIIRENNSSWPQHCQGRNYLLTQWHWLRLLATFVNFGAVTQGLPSAIVLFICIVESCPGPHYSRQHTNAQQIGNPNICKHNGRILLIISCTPQHLSYILWWLLPVSYQYLICSLKWEEAIFTHHFSG